MACTWPGGAGGGELEKLRTAFVGMGYGAANSRDVVWTSMQRPESDVSLTLSPEPSRTSLPLSSACGVVGSGESGGADPETEDDDDDTLGGAHDDDDSSSEDTRTYDSSVRSEMPPELPSLASASSCSAADMVDVQQLFVGGVTPATPPAPRPE